VNDSPGAQVPEYLSALLSDTGATTYKFVFANGPALARNTSYWILFTTYDAHDWLASYDKTGTSTSIDVSTGFTYATQSNVPSDQVQNIGWIPQESPFLILSLTISGCEASLEPTPTPTAVVSPSPVTSRSPKASATPRVVLTPITANVTSSFDSTQTALNLTAPATSTLCCTLCVITRVWCV
jgi:hypothetical protein